MDMEPRIERSAEKKLVGFSVRMSVADNRTMQLWGRLGPKTREITNRITDDKISMQIYSPDYYQEFSPFNEFEKWATVEVANFDHVPEEMETFTLEEGLYAVFEYKGSSADPSIFQFIFWQWIPNSPYEVDDRPHFEVLGEKYKNNDVNSEEEIWIPIIKRPPAP